MIIVRPSANTGQSAAPRHKVKPFHRGSPSSGRSWARTAERMPSAPTSTSPSTVVRARPRAVDEMRPDAAGVLLEALEPVVDVDHRGAGTDSQRLEQDALEAAPVDRELRDGQPCIEPRGSREDRLTVTVRHDQRAGADGDGVEGVEQPQAGELGDGRRENVDADAELADRVGLLEHVDADVPPVQGERGGETTDSPADHDRAHRAHAADGAAHWLVRVCPDQRSSVQARRAVAAG